MQVLDSVYFEFQMQRHLRFISIWDIYKRDFYGFRANYNRTIKKYDFDCRNGKTKIYNNLRIIILRII